MVTSEGQGIWGWLYNLCIFVYKEKRREPGASRGSGISVADRVLTSMTSNEMMRCVLQKWCLLYCEW